MNSVADFVVSGRFRCAEAQIASDNFNGAWGFSNWDVAWMPPVTMSAMMLVGLAAVLVILKSRDAV